MVSGNIQTCVVMKHSHIFSSKAFTHNSEVIFILEKESRLDYCFAFHESPKQFFFLSLSTRGCWRAHVYLWLFSAKYKQKVQIDRIYIMELLELNAFKIY